MREDLAVGMKEEPCRFHLKDCRPAFRFDYRGAAIHQGRLRVETCPMANWTANRRCRPIAEAIDIRGTTLFANEAIRRCRGIGKSIHFPLAVAFLLAQSLAEAQIWQPSPGEEQVQIWPGAVPDAIPNPKPESVGP